MKEMIYELCPHCSTEVSVLWDVTAQGYLTKCPSCDSCLLLCSECCRDDNTNDCDFDLDTTLCKRVVETMWMELTDIPLEIPESGEEIFAESFTLQGITFPAGSTKDELWRWFDEHHPKGVAYLMNEFGK